MKLHQKLFIIFACCCPLYYGACANNPYESTEVVGTFSNDGTLPESDPTLELNIRELDSDLSSDLSNELPEFTTCVGFGNDPSFSGQWRHPFFSGAKAIAQPVHSIQDVIATLPLDHIVIEGKFSYGVLNFHLGDEFVEGFVHDCHGWVSFDEALTDNKGRIRMELPLDLLEGPGRYELIMVVQGDGSLARGTLLVVPAETQFVVFDIDGTLTTSDSQVFTEFFTDIFSGRQISEAWPDAQSVVSSYYNLGYEVLYLTGRPFFLDSITREWLKAYEFPPGILHLTRKLGEVVPTHDGVGDYKLDYLLEVQGDHDFIHAYGNARTDIYAYQGIGLSNDDIFIIGEHAGAEGTQEIGSYTEHLSTLDLSEAVQPFIP